MIKNIGVAGTKHYRVDGNGCRKPRGRVCAFSKALHVVDFQRTHTARLIKNMILWSNTDKGNKITYFDTENELFNTSIESLCTSMGFTVNKISPWYALQSIFDNPSEASNKGSVYLLFPSYNPREGGWMPDLVQKRLMYEILENGKGLVLCEWFHYMQSINNPNKRSFSLHGDGTFPSQAEPDYTDGLFTLSPFDFDDFVDLDKPPRSVYSKNVEDDSMSRGMFNSFTYFNTVGSQGAYYTTAYNAIFSDITRTRPNVEPSNDSFSTETEVYWYVDPQEVLVTTTTTTTTVAPVLEKDIRFKVATLREDEYCGPHVKTLSGQHANLFEMINNELYLIKNPSEAARYNLKIKYSDFFKEKRFEDFYKHFSLALADCSAPISLPITDRRPIWSYYSDCKNLWDWPAGIATSSRTPDWSVSGEGTYENPFVAKLSGGHCEHSVLWLQVNEPGSLNWEIKASTESLSQPDNYCGGDIDLTTNNADWGGIYIASGNISPVQHYYEIKDLDYKDTYPDYDDGTAHFHLEPIVQGVAGSGVVKSGNSPKHLSFNPESDFERCYILLTYSKDEKISMLDDEIEATFILGTTPAPVPEDATFRFYIVNRVDGTTLSGSDNNRSERFITQAEGSQIKDLPEQNISITINDSSFELDGPLSFTFIPANSSLSMEILTATSAKINNFTMPNDGGSAIIYIDGNLRPKPTTTVPPRFTYKIIFKNMSYQTVFNYKDLTILPYDQELDNTYEYTYIGPVGTGSTKNSNDCTSNNHMTYNSIDDNLEYRESQVPILTVTDSSFSEIPKDSINEFISCLQDDIEIDIKQSIQYYYCSNNDHSFDMGEEGIKVNYGKSSCGSGSQPNPLPIKIGLPDMPEGGNTIYVRIDGVPIAKTTQPPPPEPPPPPPTTTTEEPCDDLILVLCEQTLVCNKVDDVCTPSLESSSNTIKFDTCCSDLSQDDIIRRVFSVITGEEAGSRSTQSLKADIDAHFSNECPLIPTEAFVNCDSDQSAICSTQIGIRTIAAIDCYDATSHPPNPLP